MSARCYAEWQMLSRARHRRQQLARWYLTGWLLATVCVVMAVVVT